MKLVRWLYERFNWQVKLSGFEFPSQGNTESDEIGQRLTNVLLHIHLYPKALQSGFAREHDTMISAAASLGYITSITHDGYISRQWRITSMGLKYLEGEILDARY
jgi:hypothetical protein